MSLNVDEHFYEMNTSISYMKSERHNVMYSIGEKLRVLWTVVSCFKCVQRLRLFSVWLSIPAYSCIFHSRIFSRPASATTGVLRT